MAINYESTRQTLAACRDAGVERLVFASSCSVYGANGQRLPARGLAPQSGVAVRAHADHVRGAAAQRSGDVEVIILRLATVCGVSPRMRFDLMVNTMTACATAQGAIRVSGAKQWRPHLHVQDAAEAFLLAVEAHGDARDRSSTSAPTTRTSPSARSPRRSREQLPGDADRVRPERARSAQLPRQLRPHPQRCSASARSAPSTTRSARSAALLIERRGRRLPPRAVPQRQVAERQRDACKEPREVSARLRVALIGCGRIARVHRAYLQELATGRAGRRLRRRRRGARAPSRSEAGAARRSPSLAELLERGQPDVVHVLTPPATHAPLAIELLRRRRQRAGREADGAQRGGGGRR